MARLTLFELSKVWRRRAFVLPALLLLAANIFILWYSNRSNMSLPEPSAYRQLCSEIYGMSESEKHDYVGELKETIDGVSFVDNILLMSSSEIGEKFAAEELAENPGIFEKYYAIYASGGYLRFTNSLAAEKAFIDRIYDEERCVFGYSEYLQSIQEQAKVLEGISIFVGHGGDEFSSENIKKSAADHALLTADGVSWMPSMPFCVSTQNMWSDVFLILLAFLFTTGLVTDEKQKGLAVITRATIRGIAPSISAKLIALLIHCLLTEIVFFGGNILYSAFSFGWWDINVRLQSVSVCIESSLDISILEFYVLSVFTKGLTLFAAFAVVTAFCVICGSVTVPYFAGTALWTVSWALWRFVPAASKVSPAKHLNFFAFLRTENVLGAYLNLNMGGRPVSRTGSSLMIMTITAVVGAALSIFLYRLPTGQAAPRLRRPREIHFRPHASLTGHEAYKLLIMNRGLIVIMAFSALAAYQSLSVTYVPSSEELYYRNIMLNLEGELTGEKESFIASENARFNEAFKKIQEIDAAVDAGGISEDAGKVMKARWQAVTAFYPTFERVLDQYEVIKENGGAFLYDTGWLYLLGVRGAPEMTGFLLLDLGLILAFSNAGAMEYSSGAWDLLNTSKTGRRGVVRRKIAVCVLFAALFAAVPLAFRLISVVRAFPIHGFLSPARMIPRFSGLPAFIPTSALAAAKLITQIACGIVIVLVVLGISFWRRSHIQTVFIAISLLMVPCLFSVSGFSSARTFSLYDVYSWFLR